MALAGDAESVRRLGAEGATAPETLRQKDRDGQRDAGKRPRGAMPWDLAEGARDGLVDL
jgi:hypothetical protein